MNIHPELRPVVCGAVIALSLVPAGLEFYWKQEAIAAQRSQIEQQRSAIEQTKQASELEIQAALNRAERCILIDERYPLVNGGQAFYDMNGRESKRLLPAGTELCSSVSGVTAEVNSLGKVTDILSAPPEQMREVFKRRGLIK